MKDGAEGGLTVHRADLGRADRRVKSPDSSSPGGNHTDVTAASWAVTKKLFCAFGRTSSLMVAQVAMPKVPWEPCGIFMKSVCEGPMGVFWAWPAAHCCSKVPGPDAEPVRKRSPVPKTSSRQQIGSDISP